jgi:cyclopropane-fatty-acyl-phospholipid synthase
VTERVLGLDRDARITGRTGRLDRLLRNRLHERLTAIRDGSLTLIEGCEVERYGDPAARLRATVVVEDPSFYRALALRGSLGGAEAFMEGAWCCDDLTTVVRILARNREALAGLDGGAARLARPSLALFRALRRNTRSGSRRNIASHYDLGNEFFELFLDPTLTYSCGVFEREDATMEEASIAKYDRVCRKLGIGPRDHVLEIGTGWGGFALHAAARYGCRITTTTISRRQLEVAKQRVAEAGLSDRVEVLFEDYRDLRGHYDKLVSIEMIEAVGHEHLEQFFRVCEQRLCPDGAMLLQVITVPDRDYEAHKQSVDFIKRYIFPGGHLVSVGAASAAAARASQLRLTHLEDIGPHYAETLRRWRRSMFDNESRIRALGLSESFLRMWEYYLCYCEGGFEERQISVVQALFEQPGARRGSVLGHLS